METIPDMQTLANLGCFEPEKPSPVFSLAFSPQGDALAWGQSDSTVRVGNVRKMSEVRVLRGHTDGVSAVAFTPDGALLFSGSWDRSIRAWETERWTETMNHQGSGDAVKVIALSPRRRVFTPIRSQGSRDTVNVVALAVGPDGKTLASGGYGWNGVISLWSTQDLKKVRDLKDPGEMVDSIAFSPDGKQLASTSDAAAARSRIKPESKPWVPDSDDYTAKIWRVEDGTLLATCRGHTHVVNCVVFAPNGKTLATGSTDGTVRFWDAQTGEQTMLLPEHPHGVRSIVYSKDGTCLFAAYGYLDSNDAGAIAVWDLTTSQRLGWYVCHNRAIPCMALSPDGKILATGSVNGQVKLWPVAELVKARQIGPGDDLH